MREDKDLGRKELLGIIRELRAIQKAVEDTQLGVTITDMEGRILYTNAAEAAMHGYTPEELIGRNVRIMAPPETWKKEAPGKMERIRSYRRESLNLTSDGRTFPVRLLSDLITDEEGQPVAVITTCEDISERKKMEEELRLARDEMEERVRERTAKLSLTVRELEEQVQRRREVEEALRDSEERIRIIWNSSRAASMVVDVESHRITDINAEGAEMINLPREEIIGQVCHQFVCPAEEGHCPITDQNKKVDNSERVLLDSEGREIPILKTVTSMNLGGKELLIESFVDITERKQAEEDKEMIQAQLLQAQRMEAVGKLSAGVAHDFNNILTAIMAHSSMALLKLGEEDLLKEELAKIQETTERAARLTRQLLLFSRQAPLEMIPLNVNRTIQELLKMLQRIIGEDIRIETDLDPDLDMVRADESNVEQIVMNLVVNARDSMPDGGRIGITSTSIRRDGTAADTPPGGRPGNYIRLTVSDNGTGIREENLTRIFEPFFTTKGKEEGTGLGLSVVYGIVQQHVGWITVESTPGEGSDFHIYLPVIPPPPETDDDEDIIETVKGRGERILVVEDDQAVRRFIAEILRESSYSVAEAASLGEGLELALQEEKGFDLIFADVVLPDGTGLQMVERLNRDQRSTRVLMGSGYTDGRSLEEVIQKRGYPFLHKPYPPLLLLQKVREVLDSPPPETG